MGDAVPRIQLGVAVYNGEKYLAETLESILAQTYTDFEVIISDNASTDRTRKICLSYAARDQRIRYFRNRTNLGFAPNYNRVFKLSSSEYFKWADYDDVLEPEFLARSIQALDEHPDAVLAYPLVNLIDASSTIVATHDPGPDTDYARPSDRFARLILEPELAIQTLGVIRRSAILKSARYGSYPSSDEVFLAELALMGRFTVVPERLLRVRVHEDQSTRGALANQRDRVLFYDTSLKGQSFLPKWRYLEGCLHAIDAADVDADEKRRCQQVMVKWLLSPSHMRAMGKDLFFAGRTRLSSAAAAMVVGTQAQSGDLSELKR